MEKREKLIGCLCAAFTIVVWGSTFISSKKLLEVYTPAQIMLVRFLLAYGALWLARPRKLALTRRQELTFLLLGITGCSLYFYTENSALTYTLASNVSIIVAAAPIFTAVLAHFAGLERFRSGTLLGFLVAFSGVVLVVCNGTFVLKLNPRGDLLALAAHFAGLERFRSGTLLGFLVAFSGVVLVVCNGTFVLKLNPRGDLLALAAAACWAVYSVLLRRLDDRLDPLLVTRRTLFWGILTALPFVMMEGTSFPAAALLSPVISLNFLFLGLIGSCLCFVLWNRAFHYLGVVTTNSFIYMQPFITIVAGWLFLREPISPLALVGAALITVGVVAAQRSPKQVPPAEQPCRAE